MSQGRFSRRSLLGAAGLLGLAGCGALTEGADLAVFGSVEGLAVRGGGFAAATPGVEGTGVVRLTHPLARASLRLTVTRGIPDSATWVGVGDATPGVAFGYRSGSGLGFLRGGTADVARVPDADLRDGDRFDVHLVWDRAVNPSAAAPGRACLTATYARVGGGPSGWDQAVVGLDSPDALGALLVRTNVATGVVHRLAIADPVGADVRFGRVGYLYASYSAVRGESVRVWLPDRPNGQAVIVCHGHGDTSRGDGAGHYRRVAEEGYTVFVPDMGGQTWGNDTALHTLAALHRHVERDFGLDPRVLLWGVSMGGGAALTAIAKRTLPVRAAFLAEPVCSLADKWAERPTLRAAYRNDPALARANDPLRQPVSAYAGVPLLFTASPQDTVVPKAVHTDALRARLGDATSHRLIEASGDHSDPSHFPVATVLDWFAGQP